MIVQRHGLVLMALGLGLMLGSCSSVAGVTADLWPHWAGGEPAGLPPRPGTSGYDEYIAHQQSNPAPAKPAATGDAAPAQAPPAAEAAPEDDAAVAQGGLY